MYITIWNDISMFPTNQHTCILNTVKILWKFTSYLFYCFLHISGNLWQLNTGFVQVNVLNVINKPKCLIFYKKYCGYLNKSLKLF